MVSSRSGLLENIPGTEAPQQAQPARSPIPPPRRRESSSPTQSRFLYPETPQISTRTQLNLYAAQGMNQDPTQHPQQPVQNQQQVAPIQPAKPMLNQSQQGPVTNHQNTPYVPDEQACAAPSVQVVNTINPSQVSTAVLYQESQPITPQQQALLLQEPHTQGRLVCSCHHAAANSHGSLPEPPRLAPMRPMDVAKDCFLDYVSPQSIKFYHKAIEQLPGEKFNGNMLHTWLQLITDRAMSYAWTNIFTIRGRLLTENYAEISLNEVKAHAQEYQNEGRRRAQNAEMLLQCLKASISKTVYSRVYQLRHNYTIIREPEKQEVQDGLCYLKTIIDCYHVNTRSSTAEIRKKLAQLHIYMKHTAKGDVVQLCVYTRDLLGKLRAAGEDTLDLLTNLMEALKQAPNQHFQRWLNTRIDLWSTKQIDWQADGMDLMQEAEGYYLELKTKNMWSKRADNVDESIEDSEGFYGGDEENEKPRGRNKGTSTSSAKDLAALTVQLKKFNKEMENKAMSKKHKWKYTAPKDGEPTEKQVYQCGKKAIFYWCCHHKQWTKHKPSECMLLDFKTNRQRKAQRGDYQKKKKAYMRAKAMLQALNLSSDSEENDDKNQIIDDSDFDSNNSDSTEYYSDGYNSNVS
jgi:hypothetical protein